MPLFRKMYYFNPVLQNFPLISLNVPVFNMLYVFFVSPYFDLDAFMHHTIHVLDFPAQKTS